MAMTPATVATNHGGGASGGGGGESDNVDEAAGCGDGVARLKKGPWTAEEDAILMEYVRQHGEGNWNAVQRNSGLVRCGKSCRLRWANHLRPNLKKGAFTSQEERLIIELHAKFGNKWARMAALLPGRTDNEIKNYWNTRIKRHQRQGIPLYPPDIQRQNQNQTNLPSYQYQYHQHHHSLTPAPTTPTSSFSFQTPIPSPTASVPTYLNSPTYQQHSPISPNVVANPLYSSLSYYDFSLPGTSTFTFQNQLLSPSTTNPHAATSPGPPTASPLHSPCTNNNVSTLPLFEFSLPRSPPILQMPMRFKRFSSSTPATPISMSNNNNNNLSMPLSPVNHNTQFSFPLSPLSAPSCSNSTCLKHSNSSPCFAELLRNSSDFHQEMQRENEKMCSLFAAVTQSELPSNQMLSPNEYEHTGITNIGGANSFSKSGRRLSMKRNGMPSKDKGNSLIGLVKNGLPEDLWLDTKDLISTPREQSLFVLQEERPKLPDFDSEFKPNVEAAGELNNMPEDLTDFLSSLPPPVHAKFYADNGDNSNGQSSVVTDDNIGYDMQQIASLLPSTTTDHDKGLGFCSWENLPSIC